jgi:hypothetical protein
MASTTIVWAGALVAGLFALRWWDLVDFVLDRLGPPRAEAERWP